MVPASRPLRRFGVDPERVGLVLALAIRTVPVMTELARQVQEARIARGLSRSPRALAVPLVIRAERPLQGHPSGRARGADPVGVDQGAVHDHVGVAFSLGRQRPVQTRAAHRQHRVALVPVVVAVEELTPLSLAIADIRVSSRNQRSTSTAGRVARRSPQPRFAEDLSQSGVDRPPLQAL